jgi:putative MATE family efflux protein
MVIEMMKYKKEQLLKNDLKRLFFSLTIPSIMIGLVAGLYNLVDAIIVGQFVGPEAVGAVSLSYALTLPNWALTFCFGIGSASLLSIAIGANDKRTIRRIPGNIIVLMGTISLVLMITLLLFAEPLISFIGGEGEILSLGTDYMRILCLGFPVISIGLGLNLLVRGEGRMKEVMILVAISNIVNIVLDYILIEPVGLGVRGAAMATVISQLLALTLIVSYISRSSTRTKLRLRYIKPSFDLLPKVIKVGASAAMVLLLMAIQQTMMFKILAQHGTNDDIILLSATFRLFTFLPILTKGIAEGMQPVVGTSYGARDFIRSRRAYLTFTVLGTGLMILPYVAMLAFPRAFLSMFINDPEIVSAGFAHFRLFFLSLILQVAIFTTMYYFISTGKGKQAGIIVMSRQLLFFVPLVLILPLFLGMTGVWIVIPICDMIGLIIGFFLIAKEFRGDEYRSITLVADKMEVNPA